MGILRRRTWEDIEPKLRGSFLMLCIDTVWIWCPHCSIKYCFIKNYSWVVSSHEYLFRARVYSQSDKSCWKLVTHASGHFLPTYQYNPIIYIYIYIYSIITMPFGDIEKKKNIIHKAAIDWFQCWYILPALICHWGYVNKAESFIWKHHLPSSKDLIISQCDACLWPSTVRC